MTTPHRIVHPDDLAPAVGFSHGVVAGPGRTLQVAGQIAVDAHGVVVGDDFATQFGVALGNVVSVVRAAGGEPHHITAMNVYTTDIDGYRSARRSLGAVWRRHMGLHFPAMALLGVAALVEPGALVEITATAVVPD
ncbi:MAG: RidA family protein [Acidimicrobiia bacterium]|nr:RidA family protein [Acidimicrobiia bacterium]